MTKYTIIIEKGEGNRSAYYPDLPGVVAAAKTEDGAVELMKDVIEFHLGGLKKDRLPIPELTISAKSVKMPYSADTCVFGQELTAFHMAKSGPDI